MRSEGKHYRSIWADKGWIATIDYGTATAPIYLAREAGIDVHV